MPSLPPGSRIGPYEVVGVLGAGGMGEVLRARDLSLRRDVALKVLPLDLAGGEDARARLAREARLLASLNHPYIAQVYGLEVSPAGPVMAMELVAGTTLRDRLRTGISRAEALSLAAQIATALDAAHDGGIVHRDLKPGNIMVTPEGTVKVLDFGLAKTVARAAVGDHDTTLAATIEGTIAGTPAYMSPEQLRGQTVDKRTDIWAFGCILFELFSRRPAFAGGTMLDLTVSILEREPDWQALPPDTPAALVRLVRRCLQKDRGKRMRDIGDVLHELTTPDEAVPTMSRARLSRTQLAILTAAALVLGAASSWLLLASRATSSASVRLELSPPAGARFGSSLPTIEASIVAVSPDGARIAFIASRAGEAARIWLRAVGDAEAKSIAATDNAISLFFSPDSQAIAFFADGQLKRVSVAGDAPVKICDVPSRIGLAGSWGRQGDILFATVQGDRIWRVPAAGGTPIEVVPPSADGSARRLWPWHLPDGQRYLYTESAPGKGIVLAEPNGRRTTLVESVSRAQWIEPNWLVYVREGTLVAHRIDLNARRPVGEPVSIIGSVAYSEATGWANVAASANGTILAQGHLDVRRLVWFDSAGREMATLGAPASLFTLRLAPDDGSLLFARWRPDLGTYDIWRRDLARGSEAPVTTSPGMETGETWVPGGRAIVYAAGQGGKAPNLFYKDLTTGAERQLMTMARFQYPNDVSPDGAQVIYQQRSEAGTWDLLMIPISGSQTPVALFTTAASEAGARLAPGGSRMSFASDESGRFQVYVSQFPVTGTKVAVSTAGGSNARWSRDGRTLYFVSADRKLMAAPVDSAGQPGPPRVLFDVPRWLDFDVASDGRFIAVVTQAIAAEQPLAVILNWAR